MIISLTPNPAVDQTAWVSSLEVGEVNRVQRTHLDPAGKGVNVSRLVHRLGWPTIAFGFVAGEIGRMIESALDAEGVQYHFVHVPGQSRVNVTIMDESSRRGTSLYGPGPEVDHEAREQLEALLSFWFQAGRVLVLAGSLPPGMPDDFYATTIERARQAGLKVILDTDGDALRKGIAAGPDLIKPNVAEAEHLLGRPLPDMDALLVGAEELASRGVNLVVVSMGQEGAVCVQANRIWRAVPPRVEPKSTVGSGDSLVAGLAIALARGDDIAEGLRLGTAAGAATAMTPGSSLGSSEEVATLAPAVQVEQLK